MREEHRKPKIQEVVIIPNDLVLFLTDVHHEIVAGDEVALLESDDLLQYEEFDFAYGGLTNAKTGDYRFRYFTDDENGSTWDVDLSKSNIERITMRWSSISAHKTLSAPHFIF
ncbi:MAG: hypothetical protein M3Q78_00110 [Acidobacteriota bacterium]|nr:hypothetical protein [Acidobacteriota bacterium]